MKLLPAKKVGKSFLRMLVYPVTKPATDVSSSVRGIKETWAQVEEIKKQRVSDAQAVTEGLKGMSAQEKFEQIYLINEWTEPELAAQKRAARNTRLGSLLMAVLLLPLLLWVVASSALWVSTLTGVASIFLCAACVAQAIRFSWWEAQIEERSCFPMREYLGREDLFKRMVRCE